MLAYVPLAGGLLALLWSLGSGTLARVLRNIGAVGRKLVRPTADPVELPLHRIPYALAILAGTAWAVGARYWPALRWP